MRNGGELLICSSRPAIAEQHGTLSFTLILHLQCCVLCLDVSICYANAMTLLFRSHVNCSSAQFRSGQIKSRSCTACSNGLGKYSSILKRKTCWQRQPTRLDLVARVSLMLSWNVLLASSPSPSSGVGRCPSPYICISHHNWTSTNLSQLI